MASSLAKAERLEGTYFSLSVSFNLFFVFHIAIEVITGICRKRTFIPLTPTLLTGIKKNPDKGSANENNYLFFLGTGNSLAAVKSICESRRVLTGYPLHRLPEPQEVNPARIGRELSVQSTISTAINCRRIYPAARSVQDRVLFCGSHHGSTHCEQCFACIHFCPVEAIQHGPKTKNADATATRRSRFLI